MVCGCGGMNVINYIPSTGRDYYTYVGRKNIATGISNGRLHSELGSKQCIIYRYIRHRWVKRYGDLLNTSNAPFPRTPAYMEYGARGYIICTYGVRYTIGVRYNAGPHTHKRIRALLRESLYYYFTWLAPNQFYSLYRLAYVLPYTWMKHQHTCLHYKNNVHR